MSRPIRRSRPVSLSLTTLTIAGLSIATATAGAAVTASRAATHFVWSDGTIHQCVNKKTFATRTLPSGKHCSSHETTVTFNQTGPRGKTGSTGAVGLSVAALSDDDGISPTAVPDGTTIEAAKQTTITLKQPGKILVLGATLYGASFDNTTDSTQHYEAGVLIDNTLVAVPNPFQLSVAPHASYTVSGFTTAPAMLSAAAGTHSIRIAFITTDTTANYLTSSTGRILAVATG